MIVKFLINTSDFDKKSPQYSRDVQNLPSRIIDGSIPIIDEELDPIVPVRTGFLTNSRVRILSQFFGSIIFTAPYAGYVNDGTGPSPGRYVPKLGKRIRTGMHPGQKGQHFIERAVDTAVPRIEALLDKLAKELFSY